MKKLYFPFYKSFRCVADKCPMNCCSQMRIPFFKWEERLFDTKPEWQNVDGRQHNIKDFLHEESGWLMCNTDERNYCVFCTENRLCRLQLEYGISALPSVCRTFPRVITKFPDRVEFSLEPCCPIALYSLKDWEIGVFLIEGDTGSSFAPDPSYDARQEVMDCFADPQKSLDDCFRKTAEIYNSDVSIDIPALSPFQENFLRKVCVYSIWAYVLAYEGYPGIDNIGAALLDFYAEYIPTVTDCPEDWESMSRHFAAALISYVKKIEFDLEIESRYCDFSDFAR